MEYDRPKTIEELKAFCAEKGMPLEQMRFYIGEDFPEPRAFGIFQDENGEFVVYKNTRPTVPAPSAIAAPMRRTR